MGLRRNFTYNIILTSANYIFPLLVFPYVSRVLGVYNLGIYNFVENIVMYFTMLSMMGIGVLGIREIAAVQSKRQELNNTFSNLLYLNGAFTLLSVIILIACIHLVPQFNEYKGLMYIGVINIIANYLLLDWLYKGLEDFAYVTKRTLTIKIIYVIAIFIWVNTPEDYTLYYVLTTASVVVNASVNLYHSRKYVRLSFSHLEFKKYLKPNIRLGTYWVLTTLYASFYTIYLGFVSTPKQIGYFATASKLILLTMSVYTAWTNVVMPRASAMLAEGQEQAFNSLLEKSIYALFAFSIPIIIVGCIFSDDIIWILSGIGYEGASTPSRILMPLVFVIGFSQILIIQVLMPLRKDRVLLRNALLGAIVGITMGLTLVPHYFAIGASYAWLTSELTVLVVTLIYIHLKIHILFPWNQLFKQLLWHIPIAATCIFLYIYLPANHYLRIIITGSIVAIYSLLVQTLVLKNPIFGALPNLLSILKRR